MMGIGGARPAGGGSEGAEQEPAILLGVAYVQRDVDLVAKSMFLTSYLKGCSYKVESGTVGALDAVTGRITLPAGCRIFRQTFHEATPGVAGFRAISLVREAAPNTTIGSVGAASGSAVDGMSVVDTGANAWVMPTFFHVEGSDVILDADASGGKFIGMVEFFA